MYNVHAPKVFLFIISRFMEWPKVLYIFALAHFREQLMRAQKMREIFGRYICFKITIRTFLSVIETKWLRSLKSFKAGKIRLFWASLLQQILSLGFLFFHCRLSFLSSLLPLIPFSHSLSFSRSGWHSPKAFLMPFFTEYAFGFFDWQIMKIKCQIHSCTTRELT